MKRSLNERHTQTHGSLIETFRRNTTLTIFTSPYLHFHSSHLEMLYNQCNKNRNKKKLDLGEEQQTYFQNFIIVKS